MRRDQHDSPEAVTNSARSSDESSARGRRALVGARRGGAASVQRAVPGIMACGPGRYHRARCKDAMAAAVRLCWSWSWSWNWSWSWAARGAQRGLPAFVDPRPRLLESSCPHRPIVAPSSPRRVTPLVSAISKQLSASAPLLSAGVGLVLALVALHPPACCLCCPLPLRTRSRPSIVLPAPTLRARPFPLARSHASRYR